MSSSDKVKHKLSLKPTEQNEWLKISVFDANNRLMSKQLGTFEQDLPKGLYTVVSELSGSTTEHIIKHTTPTVIDIDAPELKLSKKKLNYRAIAERQSNKGEITTSKTGHSGGGRVFLFCHALGRTQFDKIVKNTERIQILDENFETLFALSTENCKYQENEKWTAFQTYLAPGNYFIQYESKAFNRTVPFFITLDFQTQIILGMGKHPNFEGIELGVTRHDLSNVSNSRKYQSYKIAKNSLFNADYTMSDNTLKNLALGKWERPLYGFIVAYMYLLSGRSDRDDLMEDILNHLGKSILNESNNADLLVLQLIYNHRVNPSNVKLWINNNPIKSIPVFRIGVEKLVALSFDYPNLIEEGSNLDLISGRLRGAGIWTCFNRIQSKAFTETETIRTKALNMNKHVLGFSAFNERSSAINLAKLKDLWDDFFPAIIELGFVREGAIISADELAKSVGIPLVTLKRKVHELHLLMRSDNKVLKEVLVYLERIFKNTFKAKDVLHYVQELDEKLQGK